MQHCDCDALEGDGVAVDILVNNAGHGFRGKWWEIPIERDISMVRLNIEAVLRLTKLFLPPMLKRERGRLLNTASIAGFEPGPLLAVYHATEAFVLSWSEALAAELEIPRFRSLHFAQERRIPTSFRKLE
jgi:short-subunit dehydrogenase